KAGKNMKYTPKPYEELFFTDDFLFSKIMRDEEIAKGVVENLLGIKIKKVDFLSSQYSIGELYAGKGIRLDAYLEDSGKVIDIEMQSVVQMDEGLRMRYYQSIIDIEHLNRGERYRNLKESYVVFICLNDPFGDGKAVYNFATKEVDGERILNDRIHKVIYNASGFEKAKEPKVRAFLKFVKERAATDLLTRKIQEAVDTCKYHQKWRAEYMLWEDQVTEWKEEAREIGRTEGKAQGLKEGALNKAVETAKKMIKKCIDLNTISECTGLSLEEVNRLKEEND
ncbi:Rpn family recombination-promoting nuclease/putative transposase, partial [Treponema sp. UBA753]|uniref:Rpn family recombination-promoting nuclease/putative transposase n=1 Tax=Treponema sp. UBA753 TaxID=1947747 RepID=UPI0025F9DB63